jgi:hypothetical protein
VAHAHRAPTTTELELAGEGGGLAHPDEQQQRNHSVGHVVGEESEGVRSSPFRLAENSSPQVMTPVMPEIKVALMTAGS